MPHYQLKPWAESKALIVNDDGIDAEGIKVLEGLARSIFAKVVVVAPSHEHSGMGHSISYKKNFKLIEMDATHFSVEGTPADCTILGLNVVLRDSPPDIVLSGINHGDNAGNAITYSGTFGGALEAGLAGIPAVSLSQLRQDDGYVDFTVARKYFGHVMRFLQCALWPDHVVMNVNFPPFDAHDHEHPHAVPSRTLHIVEGVDVSSDENGEVVYSTFFKKTVSDQGFRHDLDVLAQGKVTITPISTNWTCRETLALWAK